MDDVEGNNFDDVTPTNGDSDDGGYDSVLFGRFPDWWRDGGDKMCQDNCTIMYDPMRLQYRLRKLRLNQNNYDQNKATLVL